MAMTPATVSAQVLADFRLEPRRLSDTVAVIEASDGESWVNMVASVGPDGILLSDTGAAVWQERLREILVNLGGGSVRYVVNTHYHSDHTSGNRAFENEATFLSHPATRAHLVASDHPSPSPPLSARALPSLLVREEVTIHWNGEPLRVWHVLRFSTRSRSRFRIIGSRGKRRSEGGAERLKKTGERQAPPQVFNGYSYRRQSLERAIHRLSEAR